MIPSDARYLNWLRASGIPFTSDETGQLRTSLRFFSDHAHGATLIYGQDYRVLFHVLRIADNDLLRQLTEKYLVGRISYSPFEVTESALLGKRLGNIVCGGQSQPSANRKLLMAPSGCTNCDFARYNSYLNTLKHERPTESWALAFASGAIGVSDTAQGRLGSAVCYVPDSAIIDGYQTRSPSRADMLVVTTDALGTITKVDTVSSILRRGSL